ncbi:MAG: hypothetical protein PQJ58_00240 [Spirochaetales bacterium]|nr:hypothetical protein [Spirochaetales bacterium]
MAVEKKNPQYDHEFFRTTGVQDFKITDSQKAPEGYPEAADPDTFSFSPFAPSFEERKKGYIDFIRRNPGMGSVKGFFPELVRINEGIAPVHYGKILGALEYADSRKDCSDFIMTGIIRMMYQLAHADLMTDQVREKAKESILGFKYWPDEPGTDSMCYWTENHHILFSTCEYLAGRLYPDEVFVNSGMTGREKEAKALPRIRKWLELRFKTGFVEWLSNVYYDEDMPALLNLVDFAGHEDLQIKAKQVVDLMFYDMALNSYYGQFVSTHGRTYTAEKKSVYDESTTDTSKLMFGMGIFANKDNMTAPLLALSENYRMPDAIFDIAADTGREEMISRQRTSFSFKDAAKWGYGKKNLTSAMGLLSAGGYTSPETIDHMVLMLDEFGWWDNKFFLEFQPFKKAIQMGKHLGLTKVVAKIMEKDLSRNVMTEANVYTCKTPDYMLSTAQDYRKSMGGDQHHIWQATLAPEAVCFTTHPGGYGLTAPDAYWHGNGFMPRSLQHKNVNITIYNTPTGPTILLAKLLNFTHAWLPKDKFDEVVEEKGWIFARKNDGYLALYSHQSWHWQTEGEEKDKEVIADGLKNIWICEMGRKAVDGSFEEFRTKIGRAEVKINGLKGYYLSPSQGKLSFGWKGAFKQDGKVIETKDYPRYENPYGQSPKHPSSIEVDSGKHVLRLDFEKMTRDFD